MRKLIRLGAAVALAASGLVIAAGPSDASVDVIDCDTPVSTPAVGVPDPDGSGPAPGLDVLGASDNCAELVRTLVFVGNAAIDNGVNFNGVGGTSPQTFDPNDILNGRNNEGGSFNYAGQCVMVNYDQPEESSAPTGEPTISDCNFNTTDGVYYAPGTAQPVISNVFGPISDNVSPHHAGAGSALDWAPGDSASCFSSSGQGSSGFTSEAPGGAQETWNADFTWTNSLNNLTGSIGLGTDRSFTFDAKIEAHADPRFASDPIEATDAGCLEKPIDDLAGLGASNETTGLNSILIAGTATWTLTVPVLLP